MYRHKRSMKVNILSWNVRGLNRQRKRVLIRSMMNNWKADVFCFQESKLEGDIREIVKELWANRWGKFAQLKVSGTRGGIVVLWDKRVWDGEISSLGLTLSHVSFLVDLRNLFGTYLVCMHRMTEETGKKCGRNWQGPGVYLMDHGWFVEILIL